MTADDGEWDFYYCRVNDAPASIFLNLAYRDERPAGFDTLHYVGLQMLEPGDHGMGVEPDVELLWELEDKITAAAAAKGFAYVGRLRNDGDWQISTTSAMFTTARRPVGDASDPDRTQDVRRFVVGLSSYGSALSAAGCDSAQRRTPGQAPQGKTAAAPPDRRAFFQDVLAKRVGKPRK